MLAKSEAARLVRRIEASNRMWRLPRYHYICYSDRHFYGKSYYNQYEARCSMWNRFVKYTQLRGENR